MLFLTLHNGANTSKLKYSPPINFASERETPTNAWNKFSHKNNCKDYNFYITTEESISTTVAFFTNLEQMNLNFNVILYEAVKNAAPHSRWTSRSNHRSQECKNPENSQFYSGIMSRTEWVWKNATQYIRFLRGHMRLA